MVVHLSAFYSREQRRRVLPSDARVAAMVQPRDGEILIREELRLGIACGPAPDGKPRGKHGQQRRWFDPRFARPGEIAGKTNAGSGLIRWPELGRRATAPLAGQRSAGRRCFSGVKHRRNADHRDEGRGLAVGCGEVRSRDCAASAQSATHSWRTGIS